MCLFFTLPEDAFALTAPSDRKGMHSTGLHPCRALLGLSTSPCFFNSLRTKEQSLAKFRAQTSPRHVASVFVIVVPAAA